MTFSHPQPANSLTYRQAVKVFERRRWLKIISPDGAIVFKGTLLLRRFAPVLRRIDDLAALDADLRIVVQENMANPYQLPPQCVGQL